MYVYFPEDLNLNVMFLFKNQLHLSRVFILYKTPDIVLYVEKCRRNVSNHVCEKSLLYFLLLFFFWLWFILFYFILSHYVTHLPNIWNDKPNIKFE